MVINWLLFEEQDQNQSFKDSIMVTQYLQIMYILKKICNILLRKRDHMACRKHLWKQSEE